MPSTRKQLNVRLDPESAERFDRLLSHIPRTLGIDLTQSQLISMALKALDEKFPSKSPRKSR